MTQAVLLLGSNIDREANFCRAARRLAEMVRVMAFSPVYESEPVGNPAQPCFLNAAALIETDLQPEQLKAQVLQCIEQELGRVRGPDKNAPRTIDLDIVLYEGLVCRVGDRQLPDPDLLRYAHIARPAADVAPEWIHPQTGVSLRAIADGFASWRICPRPDIVLASCESTKGDVCPP